MKADTPDQRLSLKNYAGAAIAVLLAAVFTSVVLPFNDGAMYFLFLAAIFFASLYGGFKSGLFAIVLSVCAALFLIIYVENLSLADFGRIAVLLLFCLTASFIVGAFHFQSKADEARKMAESKYRAIFEDAITGIYETTLDGRYAAANPKLAEMFGFDSPEQLIKEAADLNVKFYVNPERRREFVRLIEERGSVNGFESEIYRRDGARIWITENALGVRDERGKLIGFQGTTIEITARKRAEGELEEARGQLEQKVSERTAELNETNEVLRGEISERERSETELRTSREQLRALTAHLQAVREQERTRIAREIHDELGQTLTAFNIDLSWLEERLGKANSIADKKELSAKIAAMVKLVGETMNTVREIAAELRPGVLDELGLEAAFEWQVLDFQKRTNIKCELVADFDETDLSRDLMTAMFRILQECLTNIARHAEATKAKFMLRDEADDLLIEVEDDGRGIGDEEISNTRSLGLVGMRERAIMLGGSFEISGLPAGGTLVRVKIPRRSPDKTEVSE